MSDLREELLAGFAAWGREVGEEADVDTVSFLVGERLHQMDPQVDLWTCEILEDLLLGILPRKTIFHAGELKAVVPGMRSFLTYLASTGRLARGSDPLEDMAGLLYWIEEELPEAMEDDQAFGFAKRIGMLMDAEGVDVDDPDAVGAWIDRFNSLPEPERRAVIPVPDLLVPPPRVAVPDDIRIPAVRLAPPEELAAAAASAPMMVRLGTFVRWVGAGRKLTQSGNLKPADAVALIPVLGLGELPERYRVRSVTDVPAVDWTCALADEAGLVDITPKGLVPTALGVSMGGRPLDAWKGAFDALLEVGVLGWIRGRSGWAPPWVEMVDETLGDVLALAYLHQGDPVRIEDLAELAWEAAGDRLPPGGSLRDRLRPALANDLRALASVLADAGLVKPDGDGFVLTPLGVWGTNGLLRESGLDALAVTDPMTADPADLLAWWGELDEGELPGEVDAWLEGRDPAAVVRDMAVAARADAGARTIFLSVLARLGSEAEPAVRALAADEDLRPCAATWLVERGLEAESFLRPEDMERMLIDQMVGMLEAGGPDALIEVMAGLGPPDEQRRAVRMIGASRTPQTKRVLSALTEHHPDPTVAAAARGALTAGPGRPGKRERQERRRRPR